MKVEVKRLRSGDTLCHVDDLSPESSIAQVKRAIHRIKPNLYPSRQQLKASNVGKSRALKDEDILGSLFIGDGGVLYFTNLGPQIAWSTVFLCEYAGPLFVYLLFYLRPTFIYGSSAGNSMAQVVHVAMVCWTLHYAKRLYETVFVHRFSHGTMPLRNLFKNCGYYWGFAAFIAYYVNHPLYTPAMYGPGQILLGLLIFAVGEMGNFCIHLSLRNLRPEGSKERKIPYPTSNPFTALFNTVSCPNYTYETISWIGFSLLAQSLPAFLFTLAGFLQMAQWALGKHRNYCREFEKYPRKRRAIVPFLL